ncbi:MAG TPA: erythromycin esterase family protein [Segetibacter sp.]|nr:erythromycin esterase family protein [Segetibacter sp.]
MRRFGNNFLTGNEQEAINLINANAVSLNGFHDIDPLFDKIGKARIVMLGEASHGTHEYYTWRTYITKRLILEKGFNFIAVEGDWPDCYKINSYIKQDFNEDKKAADLLQTFDRWPTWMWANWEIAALVEWLQLHNQSLPQRQKTGFYGLDVYSLWESLEAIMKYLEKVDPAALEKAMETFQCFEPYKEDGTSYAYATRVVPELCENEVLELLNEIQRKLPQYDSGAENVFSTEQNALIAVNAEKYYRAMIQGQSESWNVRDSHMQETLERLLDFHGQDSKAIVWAHNTHIGDSSATDMADDGMYNIGELSRKRFPGETFMVGFGSYGGRVIAGNSWGAKMQHMIVPDALKNSWENILHKTGKRNLLIFMDSLKHSFLAKERIGHRAIGVVYRPQNERYGNYVPSVLPSRYDAFIYIDKTTALHPLHITPHGHQTPETYPFGV